MEKPIENKARKRKESEALKFEPRPMVGWYDARQLLGTAVKTVVSSVFGAYSDKREIQAALVKCNDYDYSDREEIWIDYMSDTGDGFHSTFSMANLLSADQLTVDGIETFKGDILVLGGDQVYPVATREDYENRLRGPFDAACRNQVSSPPNGKEEKEHHLYAVPGNHDWYDGLSNFIKIFCQGRTIGNWLSRQCRSYFAIKLPHNWWLWGIDIQLSADIDYPQLQYFDSIVKKMSKGDKVILCTAEPSWTFTTRKKDRSYENLKFFEQRYIIDKEMELAITIAGDLHHYARYELISHGQVSHKITSGGGGAFMHPTHNLKDELNLREGSYFLQKTFPEKEKSRKLAFWNLAFPLFNPQFAFFMGAFYVLFAWELQEATKSGHTFFQKISLYEPQLENLRLFTNDILNILLMNPLLVFVIAAVIFGVTKFTDTNASKKNYLWVLGTMHGLVHILIGFGLFWLLSYWLGPIKTMDISHLGTISLLTVLIFVSGGLLGCLVMGLYLLITNLLFRIHDNEAFSAIKWAGYKNFLRMHISREALSIYPIGLEKTARWKKQGKRYEPNNPLITKLVDKVITIKSNKHEKESPGLPVITDR
jgi:hypothetical protein